jgi:hypothetical protein
MFCNSSLEALARLSSDRYFFAKTFAVVSPICLIPIANINFSNELFLERLIFCKMLLKDFSLILKSPLNMSFLYSSHL